MKLFDLNDYKDKISEQAFERLEQMKRFLLHEKQNLKDDEFRVVAYNDYTRFCLENGELVLSDIPDFVVCIRFWFKVADYLSEQGKIEARRIHFSEWV